MTEAQVRAEVIQAFRNAADNGYYFQGWSDPAVADDMMMYCSALENADPEEVLKAVAQVRAEV